MISIIVCSKLGRLSPRLENNIKDTVGTPFEIICIDNSKGEYGICSAYNEGVKRANGDFLCFMHEDVTFLSRDWGVIGMRDLSDSEVGMIGVLGCTFYDECMPYWFFSPFGVGHNWCGRWHKIFSRQLKYENVVAIDGLWILTRKELFDGLISWDEVNFPGYDMYDMDISMQIIKIGKKISVEPNICIEHSSNGNYSVNFYEAAKVFHNKWDYMLPVSANSDISAFSKLSKQYAFQTICGFNVKYNTFLKGLMRLKNTWLWRFFKKK